MVDYTPVTAVAAGKIVNYLGKACIAHTDIPANTLGALAWPNGSSVYAIESTDTFASGEDTLTAGDTLYMETADGELSDTATGAVAVGPVMATIGSAAAGVGVYVVHGG